ncbi:MAG TPA: FHA domain-containing protein [Gemmataceae bacterium]|nr:FHA domain-containing protein [Gemmataceae bacterium]
MPAQLLALTDGPSILLDKPILLLGRHGECDVQLNSRKVSRRHCCIAQVSDYLIVRDLGSTNGVRINGQRVIEGRLRGGDELTVGNFRYQVAMEAASTGAGPPPIQLPVPVDSELEWADEPVPLDEATAAAGSGRILPAKPAQRPDEPLVLPDNLRNPPPPDEESSL